MLKITLHDSSRELRFQLEGKLSGPWVAELQQYWQTARSTTQGRSTVIDLGEIDFVDPEGQSLLAEMHRHRRPPAGADAVHPIAGRRSFGRCVLCYG